MKPFFYFFTLLAVVAAVPVTAAAQSRYQVISLSEGVDMGSEKVMILDSTSGHLWTGQRVLLAVAAPGDV